MLRYLRRLLWASPTPPLDRLVAGARYRFRLPWPDNVAVWRFDGEYLIDDDTVRAIPVSEVTIADLEAV
jgi:hypothetical protein